MPVIINEVITEIRETVTESVEHLPSAHQQPLSAAEIEVAETLDRLQIRSERLMVD